MSMCECQCELHTVCVEYARDVSAGIATLSTDGHCINQHLIDNVHHGTRCDADCYCDIIRIAYASRYYY